MKKFNRIKKLSKTIFAIIAMIGLQATNTHAMKRSHSNEPGNEQNITPHERPSAKRTENAPSFPLLGNIGTHEPPLPSPHSLGVSDMYRSFLPQPSSLEDGGKHESLLLQPFSFEDGGKHESLLLQSSLLGNDSRNPSYHPSHSPSPETSSNDSFDSRHDSEMGTDKPIPPLKDSMSYSEEYTPKRSPNAMFDSNEFDSNEEVTTVYPIPLHASPNNPDNSSNQGYDSECGSEMDTGEFKDSMSHGEERTPERSPDAMFDSNEFYFMHNPEVNTGEPAMPPKPPVIRPINLVGRNISPMPLIPSSHFTVNTENFENYFEVKFDHFFFSKFVFKRLLISPRLPQTFLNKEILQQFLIEKRSQIFSGFEIENPEISNIFNVFDLIIINSKIETGEHHLLNQDEWEVRNEEIFTKKIYINKNFLQKNDLHNHTDAVAFYAAAYN